MIESRRSHSTTRSASWVSTLALFKQTYDTGGVAVKPPDLSDEREGFEREQWNLPRKEHGSNDWQKQRQTVAHRYASPKRKRRDVLHELSIFCLRALTSGSHVAGADRRSYVDAGPDTAVKHLPKHLRPRWRYLAVGLESWPDAGSAALDGSVLTFRFENGDGEAVVRARRGEVERLRAVLATVDAVGGDPVGVVVRGVSGTVRACEEKYIRGPSEGFEKGTVAFDGSDRPAVVRGDRVDATVGDGRVGATALDTDSRDS